ncbi:hypothetical protein ABIA14_004780 [Sinorhizobium fredii]
MKIGSATSLPLTVCDWMIDGKVRADHVFRGRGQVDELVGELRRPDDVRLVDVDVLVSGRQPQPVLAELLAARRRHGDETDLVAGLLFEGVELLAHEMHILAGGVGRKRKLRGGGKIGSAESGAKSQGLQQKCHDRWLLQILHRSKAPQQIRKRFGWKKVSEASNVVNMPPLANLRTQIIYE